MLPNEQEAKNPSEMATSSKSQPMVCETIDVVTFPVAPCVMKSKVFEFLSCLIHGKKCCGGKDVKHAPFCAPNCYVSRIDSLRWFNLHLISCHPGQCDLPPCKDARKIYEHWTQCNAGEPCDTCSPIVRFIIRQFCAHLRREWGLRYENEIRRFLAADDRTLKNFINRSM